MLDTDTRITLVFVALGVFAWLLVRSVTDSTAIQFAVLIGVGVLGPQLVQAWLPAEKLRP
ncbi:hypothetical protein RH831_03820 [Halodesulfurarchaeum sp. HSR-GB]|uniref:hypothetical protein n=1 Tax=Halodesulfurarchaeum sp. HSR-GB TaxID=3074077 RepID=UPI0028638195|nr:hypothetical protein [Halodesulfurarchaeum sp. HSR-GB]MDR5656306.1 hypothetical protein [Halodesulfurarchaeum sp. HSR-GB]